MSAQIKPTAQQMRQKRFRELIKIVSHKLSEYQLIILDLATPERKEIPEHISPNNGSLDALVYRGLIATERTVEDGYPLHWFWLTEKGEKLKQSLKLRTKR